MRNTLFVALLLYCYSAAGASGPNDDSFTNYLERTGLKAEECAAHSPAELFPIIQQRENLHYLHTPGSQADAVTAFYKAYRTALQPLNDARHSKVAEARPELRELFYFLSDSFLTSVGHRTYITRVRIDGFVEHLISDLASQLHTPLKTGYLSRSPDDTAAYLRTRLVLVGDGLPSTIDFDAFQAKVSSLLQPLVKRRGDLDLRALYYYAITFADEYPKPLEAWDFPPAQ